MGFYLGGGNHRGEVPFLSRHSKVRAHNMAEVLFAWSLLLKLLFSYFPMEVEVQERDNSLVIVLDCTLWKKVAKCGPHSRSREFCTSSLRENS